MLRSAIKNELSADSRSVLVLCGALVVALGVVAGLYVAERTARLRFMRDYLARQNRTVRRADG